MKNSNPKPWQLSKWQLDVHAQCTRRKPMHLQLSSQLCFNYIFSWKWYLQLQNIHSNYKMFLATPYQKNLHIVGNNLHMSIHGYIVNLAQIGWKTLNCDTIILKPYVKIAQTKLKKTSNFDIKSIWFPIV